MCNFKKYIFFPFTTATIGQIWMKKRKNAYKFSRNFNYYMQINKKVMKYAVLIHNFLVDERINNESSSNSFKNSEIRISIPILLKIFWILKLEYVRNTRYRSCPSPERRLILWIFFSLPAYKHACWQCRRIIQPKRVAY